MPQDLPADFIWIQDASVKYGRSIPWLYDRVKDGKLTAKQIAGDKKTYLLESQLRDLLRPQDHPMSQQHRQEQGGE